MKKQVCVCVSLSPFVCVCVTEHNLYNVYGTAGLTIGDPVLRTHQALCVELGPGLLDNVCVSLSVCVCVCVWSIIPIW